MFRKFLALLGLNVVYVCEWGEYSHRYDDIDRMMTRPIHKDMSVAPPWARIKFVKASSIKSKT